MKTGNESVFKNSLRAFFVAFSGVIGALIALFVIVFALAATYASMDDETFSNKIKILPDANGKRKELASSTPVILQIDIDGVIGKDPITAEKIEEILLDSREDDFKKDRVKGIMLVINSPGGSANESDIIYRYLKAYKKRYEVPIYAFVNGLAASGGYYIACAADRIFTSNVSLIGSVGVISWPPFFNVTGTMEKIGVDAVTVSAGRGKDLLNPFRKWGDDEQKHRQEISDFLYKQFVNVVAANRPIERDEVVRSLGAKVLPAPEAQALGLVDRTDSTRSEVLRLMTRELGIEEKYQVVGFETKNWVKQLFEQRTRIKHELSLPSFHGYQFSYL